MQFAYLNYLCMKKGIKISMDILEENFKLHYRPLCMYATSMLGTTDNVEDIVLDCFVKLWDVLKVKHIDNIKTTFINLSGMRAMMQETILLYRNWISIVPKTSHKQR